MFEVMLLIVELGGCKSLDFSDFFDAELFLDVLCPFRTCLRTGDETVVGNRGLHLLKSPETLITACFPFCRLE